MQHFPLRKAFTFVEPGPVMLVTTNDGNKDNVMTLSWSMVLDFSPIFAISTGEWNYSFAALETTRQCVLALPTADMIDTVVGIGTCSGQDTNKFDKFGLTSLRGEHVQAPLIEECYANIECRVTDIIKRQSIIVLEGLAAYWNPEREEKRILHAVGDGTFTVDGEKIDRKDMMRSKLPAGI